MVYAKVGAWFAHLIRCGKCAGHILVKVIVCRSFVIVNLHLLTFDTAQRDVRYRLRLHIQQTVLLLL